MVKSYHYTVYGDYGRRLPRDLHGFCHLTAARWLAAPMDTAGEPMTEEQAEALAEQARAATRDHAAIPLDDDDRRRVDAMTADGALAEVARCLSQRDD